MRRGKREILDRYEWASDGRVVIDVAAPRVEDLYEFYDRTAPYVKRDLDEDLVGYLIACARELRSEDFVIRLTLENPPGDGQVMRVKNSVTNFFSYLTQIERDKTHDLVRRSAVLLGLGLAILSISVWVNSMLGQDRGVIARVFAEGLTVAAWVSLWESLATFLIDWWPQHRRARLYRRLADAQVTLGPRSGPPAQAAGNTR